MRFLIVNRLPAQFLENYHQVRGNSQQDYQSSLRDLMGCCVYSADFYSAQLKCLGHEAFDVISNDWNLQQKWLRENGVQSRHVQKFKWFRKMASPIGKILRKGGTWGGEIYHKLRPAISTQLGVAQGDAWINEVLLEQVKVIKPDILYFHFIHGCDDAFFDKMRPHVRMIVGQHASPIPLNIPFHRFDLLISSLPNLVELFRKSGAKSEYLPWCFEPSILNRVKTGDRRHDLTFVGGITGYHEDGVNLLEWIASRTPIELWGYLNQFNLRESNIQKAYKGEAWGLDMYRILGESKITLNRHVDVAGPYANNMRLFEATGMGALLLTDYKENLQEFFDVEKELITYRTPEECLEKIKYYLQHDAELKSIAQAGQRRTLRDHGYSNRMKQLEQIIKKHI